MPCATAAPTIFKIILSEFIISAIPKAPTKKNAPAQTISFFISFLAITALTEIEIILNIGSITLLKMEVSLSRLKASDIKLGVQSVNPSRRKPNKIIEKTTTPITARAPLTFVLSLFSFLTISTLR